jgi:predicted RNase H-like HicB family nuclease/DNA-binding XRE family transcriptional regulator
MVPSGYYGVLRADGEGNVLVRFPQHPGVNTFGCDWEEAEDMANEALNLALESDFDRGVKLPALRKPRVGNDERVVLVPLEAEVRMAFVLREWRESAGLTQKGMASRLGISYQAYQRMERPGRSNLTVSTLDRIARALDRDLVISVQ